MEIMTFLFRQLFDVVPPQTCGSADHGLLYVICLAMYIDGKVRPDEMREAVQLVSQLYTFEEYEEEDERVSLIKDAVNDVTRMGPVETLKLVGELLPEVAQREVAIQLIAYIHDSDGRVAPIETALLDLAVKALEISPERLVELLDALDERVSRERNAMQHSAMSPLLDWESLPRFDEVRAEQLEPAAHLLISELEVAFAALEQSDDASFEGIVAPLTCIQDRLSFTWGLAGHLLAVCNEDALRDAYEVVQGPLVALSVQFGQSRPLYERLLKVQASDELDEAQRRIVDALVLQAQHSGVGLEEESRARFNAIQAELAQLSTRFSNNVLDATRAFELVLTDPAQVGGLEASTLRMAAQSARQAGHEAATAEAGPWRITLDIPSLLPVLKNAADRALREQVYRAYMTRASSGELDNTPLIDRKLALRAEEAALLGYDTFAALSLSSKMAPDVAAVEALLEALRVASWEPAQAELEELRAFAVARAGEEAADLQPWDVSYWAERMREERYGYRDEEIRPYFPFPRVLSGFFALVERLFGVQIVAAPGEAVTWHEDVTYYKVFDGARQLASFFLDPYSRPATKRGGAWQNTAQSRHRDGDHLRLPVAYMVCNQTPPVDGQPSLMTFQEVTTLFHEFGHGLHTMLTEVDHAMAAGTQNVEWDAVELPSQFMENWCYQPALLRELTGHVETGEPLPDHYIDKIIAAKNYRAASQMLRQVNLSLLDMTLHAHYSPGGERTVFDVQREVAERTSVLPLFEEDRFLCSFSHIFAGGYAAGYYSYKWAEVLSADAFEAFEEAGLEDEAAVRETGERFRRTVLARGGARDPMQIFEDFRGRAPRVDALLRHSGLSAA